MSDNIHYSKHDFPDMSWHEKILPEKQMQMAKMNGFFNLSMESLFRFALEKSSLDDIDFSQDNLVRVFCRLSHEDIPVSVKNWAFAVLAFAADGCDQICTVRIGQSAAGRKRRQSHRLMEQFRSRYEIGRAVAKMKADKVRSPNKVAATMFACSLDEVKDANRLYRFMQKAAGLSPEIERSNSPNY